MSEVKASGRRGQSGRNGLCADPVPREGSDGFDLLTPPAPLPVRRPEVSPDTTPLVSSPKGESAHRPKTPTDGGRSSTPTQTTHCRSGQHEMTFENTYVDQSGHRHCRACRRLRRAKWLEKNPGARITCPDCRKRRFVSRPQHTNRPETGFPQGICRSCAMKRVGADLPEINVTDALRRWWLKRFTEAELHVLASGLIELAPEHRTELRLTPIKWDSEVAA